MAANDAQQDQLEALLQQINQLNAENQGKAATQFSFKELTAYLNFNKKPHTSLRHPRHHWDSSTSTYQSTLIIVIRYMLLAFWSIISTPSPKVITKRIGNKDFHWRSNHWTLHHPYECCLYPGSTASASSTKSVTASASLNKTKAAWMKIPPSVREPRTKMIGSKPFHCVSITWRGHRTILITVAYALELPKLSHLPAQPT
jgi:hypothetical protein